MKVFKTILLAFAMTASLNSHATTKVTCSDLRAAYNLLVKKFGENNKAVKLAKAYLDKVCPVSTETRIYECNVFQTASIIVPLGLDSASMLTFSSTPAKIVCATQTGCAIANTKFTVQSTVATSRCSANSSDASIVRLSDADMQTKINQLP